MSGSKVSKGQRAWLTKWANEKLSRSDDPTTRGPHPDIVDAFTNDVRVFASLAQVLSNKQVKVPHKRAFSKFQKLDNASSLLVFFRGEGVQFYGVGPEDIVDGNEKMILGLLWSIICNYSDIKHDPLGTGLLNWVADKTAAYGVSPPESFSALDSGTLLALSHSLSMEQELADCVDKEEETAIVDEISKDAIQSGVVLTRSLSIADDIDVHSMVTESARPPDSRVLQLNLATVRTQHEAAMAGRANPTPQTTLDAEEHRSVHELEKEDEKPSSKAIVAAMEETEFAQPTPQPDSSSSPTTTTTTTTSREEEESGDGSVAVENETTLTDPIIQDSPVAPDTEGSNQDDVSEDAKRESEDAKRDSADHAEKEPRASPEPVVDHHGSPKEEIVKRDDDVKDDEDGVVVVDDDHAGPEKTADIVKNSSPIAPRRRTRTTGRRNRSSKSKKRLDRPPSDPDLQKAWRKAQVDAMMDRMNINALREKEKQGKEEEMKREKQQLLEKMSQDGVNPPTSMDDQDVANLRVRKMEYRKSTPPPSLAMEELHSSLPENESPKQGRNHKTKRSTKHKRGKAEKKERRASKSKKAKRSSQDISDSAGGALMVRPTKNEGRSIRATISSSALKQEHEMEGHAKQMKSKRHRRRRSSGRPKDHVYHGARDKGSRRKTSKKDSTTVDALLMECPTELMNKKWSLNPIEKSPCLRRGLRVILLLGTDTPALVLELCQKLFKSPSDSDPPALSHTQGEATVCSLVLVHVCTGGGKNVPLVLERLGGVQAQFREGLRYKVRVTGLVVPATSKKSPSCESIVNPLDRIVSSYQADLLVHGLSDGECKMYGSSSSELLDALMMNMSAPTPVLSASTLGDMHAYHKKDAPSWIVVLPPPPTAVAEKHAKNSMGESEPIERGKELISLVSQLVRPSGRVVLAVAALGSKKKIDRQEWISAQEARTEAHVQHHVDMLVRQMEEHDNFCEDIMVARLFSTKSLEEQFATFATHRGSNSLTIMGCEWNAKSSDASSLEVMKKAACPMLWVRGGK